MLLGKVEKRTEELEKRMLLCGAFKTIKRETFKEMTSSIQS